MFHRSTPTMRRWGLLGALAFSSFLPACTSGSGGSSAGQAGVTGEEMTKADGSSFFVDPNSSGQASRLQIEEMFWARLVDVHDIQPDGTASAQPIFRDFAVNENILTAPGDYRLETNPITEQTRLVIERQRGLPDTGSGTFDTLLRRAQLDLPPIAPKDDDGSSTEPFSFVARNSTLVIRFNDCLDDDAAAQRDLFETVKVLTGYPPTTPYAARIVFDPSHGALIGDTFHSTRVLVDMTVTEAEASGLAAPQPLNSLGLPASLTTTGQPNVSIRIPTKLDVGAGQFALLRNLSGSPMATSENGPVDTTSPTVDVVRAMRSGNPGDTNNGFLVDLNPPELVGAWPVVIEDVSSDPIGEVGFSFLLDLRFDTICQNALARGDILSVGNNFLEVVAPSVLPDPSGRVSSIRVRTLGADRINTTTSLLGAGVFQSTYDPSVAVPTGCWISFVPQPAIFPAEGLPTNVQVLARFSEPMDPTSLAAFDTFKVVRGDSNTPLVSTNIVVGDIIPASDLKEFNFTPVLPLAHLVGQSDLYHVQLTEPTDLAGNGLANRLPFVDFSIDPTEATERTGGFVMRFSTPDELEPIGFDDVRGQFFFDIERGVILPRPVTFSAVPADRTNPVPSIMIPFPPGVQTPLSPLGSKLQTVWRYADLGWAVRDETKYNVDVYGLNWSPIGGQVTADFYEEFEIRLAHSRFLPDEDINSFLLPRHENSGLRGRGAFFTDNILNDPLAPQKVMHPRSLGYQINPADLFVAATNTLLMPFPLNIGAEELVTYTWRDTAALGRAGPGNAGVPMGIEVGVPLNLEDMAGVVAPPGQVPTFGLPLLMEYRCYPSSSGVGLNAFDISLAINSSPRPSFRSFSTGGTNAQNQSITKNPDLELSPTGGFNPSNGGKQTARADDNAFYVGQLDIVIRVSRAHTIWLDSQLNAPEYLTPVVEPGASQQPNGTEVILDYRGATEFSVLVDPFDAGTLDPYGNVPTPIPNPVTFLNGKDDWCSDLRELSGAQFVQVRISFLNNIETGLNPELSAIGIPFLDPL